MLKWSHSKTLSWQLWGWAGHFASRRDSDGSVRPHPALGARDKLPRSATPRTKPSVSPLVLKEDDCFPIISSQPRNVPLGFSCRIWLLGLPLHLRVYF